MIGDGIKLARKKRGMIQNDLAKRVEVSQTHLSQIETNEKDPSMKLLYKIEEALEVPLAILFWLGFKREEIQDEKKQIFDILKPSINDAMEELFDE